MYIAVACVLTVTKRLYLRSSILLLTFFSVSYHRVSSTSPGLRIKHHDKTF